MALTDDQKAIRNRLTPPQRSLLKRIHATEKDGFPSSALVGSEWLTFYSLWRRSLVDMERIAGQGIIRLTGDMGKPIVENMR